MGETGVPAQKASREAEKVEEAEADTAAAMGLIATISVSPHQC